jgi:hypothetical protein
LPHLRFTRDRRGYENTFLVDTVRRRGREHGRVLYWFRSPPQVKVGRAAIDEGAIRALEDAYPDVTFDWSRILEARPPEPEPVFEERRARPRGRDRDRRREPRPPGETSPRPLESSDVVARETESQPLAEIEEDAIPLASIEEDRVEAEPDAAQPEPVAHATEPSAAARVLGSEGLLRLRARYAEVGARIATQVNDAARQEELRILAERLNPDAWVTDADVASGLEQFEQVLDQIRREVGPLRRRTRRGGRRNRRRREGAAAGVTQPQETTATTGEPDASHDHEAPETGVDMDSDTDAGEPDDSGPDE